MDRWGTRASDSGAFVTHDGVDVAFVLHGREGETAAQLAATIARVMNRDVCFRSRKCLQARNHLGVCDDWAVDLAGNPGVCDLCGAPASAFRREQIEVTDPTDHERTFVAGPVLRRCAGHS